MTKTTKGNARLDTELFEIAEELRGTAISKATADKITMRVLGDRAPARPEPLAPGEIRKLRQSTRLSQAVFARILNVTPGYVSQLERGTKEPTGAALAMLHVIRRKGINAVL